MTRRTWFKSITGAFATLATGLGLRKVEKKPNLYVKFPLPGTSTWMMYWHGDVLTKAVWDGDRWHFEDVKPEEE